MTDDDPKDPSGDHTPIPPPAPDDRESIEDMRAVAEEDRLAREAANIPRAPTSPPPSAPPDAEPTANVPPIKPPDVWDGIGAWLVRHGSLPALGIITIAITIIHARIFHGETAGDDLTFHYAESHRIAECLAAGDFDFWNPSANAGYASLYYYQAIPQLASAIPAAIFGHHLFWFQLSVVLPLILAPAATYKGMRLLGATPWQALAGAFCVGFMNGESRWGSGNAGTFVVGLYTQTWALCAFPLALGYAAKWVTEGKNLASAVAWSGFVLLCHPFGGISLGFAVALAFFANMIMRVGFDPVFRALAPSLRGGRVGDWFANRWENPPKRPFTPELWRSGLLAVLFVVTSLPVALPLLIDGEGFGGFPHRVSDEIGPGFAGLWKWYASGGLLDFINKNMGARLMVLTIGVPIAMIFARGKYFRWLWAPAVFYALMLGLGPKLGKIGDDLIPPVRFLGAMQTLLAMGVGGGAIAIGTTIWKLIAKVPSAMYGVRTALAASAAALTVLVAVPGGRALAARVRVFSESDSKRPELVAIAKKMAELPQGRKQAGPGAENHWYNMLPYVWEGVPSTLQMGGGGLQASPNYDFLWTQRDATKDAWIFDAPYYVFNKSRDKNLPNGVTEMTTESFELRRLPAPGLVSPVNIVGVLPPGYRHVDPGHKKALEWIKSDQPMKDEVLVYMGYGRPSERAQGKTLRSWRQPSPGDDADIVAEVEVEAPTTFMVRESWHPRWHAYVDGEEVPVMRVTPDFPAVAIGAGKHTLEMRFERPLWAHLAWLAWPLPPLLAWLLMRKRHRLLIAIARPIGIRLSPPEEAPPTDVLAIDPAARLIALGGMLLLAGVLIGMITFAAKTTPGTYVISSFVLVTGVALITWGSMKYSDRA